jgi:hypothetical protein
MSTTVEVRSDIPDAPLYVLANDSFMSGWGMAEGLTNTVVLACESYEEAEVVADNARARSDMRRVRIVGEKPRLRRGVLYSFMSRDDADRWYRPGSFRHTGNGS